MNKNYYLNQTSKGTYYNELKTILNQPKTTFQPKDIIVKTNKPKTVLRGLQIVIKGRIKGARRARTNKNEFGSIGPNSYNKRSRSNQLPIFTK
jgi:hypothetical protein